MTTGFRPGGLSTWIGSLPVSDHKEAVQLMATYTPEIPVWIQLPYYAAESMIAQFLPGMPGIVYDGDKTFIQTEGDSFDDEVVSFFEAYINVVDGKAALSESRFALAKDVAPGFYEFLTYLDNNKTQPRAVKGQVTGPFTFSTSVKDQNDRAIFYNDQLRDISIKCIAMKARWQVNRLKRYRIPVIIFLDEPGLAGFGTSAFISVSKEDILACFEEVVAAVHQEGGLAGVHVCANTDWTLVLDSSADIVSFDAYSFFDKFILYGGQIRKFVQRGGILAWGIGPTDNVTWINQENTESLFNKWLKQFRQIEKLNIAQQDIIAQSLITPSCGAGSLPLDQAKKVFQMTRDISLKIQKEFIKI